MLVPTPSGGHIPLGEVATLKVNSGPPMIKSENSRRTAWVYVDMTGRDIGSFLADAQKAVNEQLHLQAGYTLSWSGQFENIQEANARLKLAIPLRC